MVFASICGWNFGSNYHLFFLSNHSFWCYVQTPFKFSFKTFPFFSNQSQFHMFHGSKMVNELNQTSTCIWYNKWNKMFEFNVILVADALHTLLAALLNAFKMSKYCDARVCSWFIVCLSDRSAASSFLLVLCYCFIFNIKSIRTFRGIMLVSHFRLRLRLRFSSSWFRCCCFSYKCSRYVFCYFISFLCICRTFGADVGMYTTSLFSFYFILFAQWYRQDMHGQQKGIL